MNSPRHFVATGYVVCEGKTLLLWHKKLGMWLPPGGHIDDGELPEEAVRREIREETGLEVEIASPKRAHDPANGKVLYLHVPNHVQLEHIPNHPQHIDLIYFCRTTSSNVRMDDREHERFRWCSEEELRTDPSLAEEVRITALEAIRFVESVRENVL